MKTKLTLILLSLIMSVGLASCTQSDEKQEATEIQESIEKAKRDKLLQKSKDEFNRRVAAMEERNRKQLEKTASTPEGRESLRKSLLRMKYTYDENGYNVFKLSRDEALKLGFTQEEYDRIIRNNSWFNHITDSLKADNPSANVRNGNAEEYEQARNGTHEYYNYLKKYGLEDIAIPPITDR